ncbi:TadE/TadG family type IV pilus assembly protein [Brevundimonas lutea]|uniref:TadE/TadG family type IV pilus assembly protein n=1 Tax=Brevundimonas lutea TaxID=2293980 RepID=UPI0013CE76F0|nr:TadE family protein [Brevundimonas lutea]
MRPGPLDRARRRVARMKRREGATAVEFAMVALPFFFMMFAVLELGLVFVLDTTLENAVIDTGRLVRTGQAQASGMTRTQFEEKVCERMTVFASGCGDQLDLDVRIIPQFGGANPPEPIIDGEFDSTGLRFESGEAGDIILVSAWYRHPLLTPFLSQALARMDGNTAVLTATTAFKNEPFGPPSGGGS